MPTQAQPGSNAAQNSPTSPNAQPKRKPSRRANTAERRATHNAVERQRRETLNGRFLDLAALLPNLSQIRRPSKSSIVNSSIAHIHASRRHRILASRELRLLKLETDTLRRELNEWRERAGIPRIEEPIRGDGFAMILNGELEVIVGVPGNNAGEDDEDDDGMDTTGYGGYVGGDGVMPEDDFISPGGVESAVMASATTASPSIPSTASALEDPHVFAMLQKQQQQQFSHMPQHHSMSGLPALLPRPSTGGATNVPASFEALYDQPQYPPHHPMHRSNSNGMYQQQMAAHQHNAYMQQQQHFREREIRDIREREQRGEMGHSERERELIQLRERERMMQQKQQQEWGMYNNAQQNQRSLNYNYPGLEQGGNQQQQQHMMMMAQRSLFTPPATSHGLPTPSPTNTNGVGSLAGPINTSLANGSGNAGMPSPVGSAHGQHIPASPTSLASPAIGSAPQQIVGRERSGSVHSLGSVHSAGSPAHSGRGSHSPAYELGAGMQDYMNAGNDFGGVPRGMNVGPHGHGMMGLGMGMQGMGGMEMMVGVDGMN